MTGKAFALAAMLALPLSAEAATVATGYTAAGDGGGIVGIEGPSIAACSVCDYARGPSGVAGDPYADWVWIGHNYNVDAASFEFRFDLAGYDLSTAALTGVWAVDNVGEILLNGVVIASLEGDMDSHWQTLHVYEVVSGFLGGVNVLTFNARDIAGAAGLRASAIVTAEALPVPLPPAAALMLTGLAGLAGLRRRRRP